MWSNRPRQSRYLLRPVGAQPLDDAPLQALDLIDLKANAGQVVKRIAEQMVGLEANRQRLKQPLGGPFLDSLAELSALAISAELSVVYAAIASVRTSAVCAAAKLPRCELDLF